ncbi:hypothetical protein Barb6XT_00655 [Bacteroidales bacterium Barb6XT]|nr:hypothetical protein Barb6XT_00655 [Bacteroidales bacterium Barb6XT]
MVLGMNKKSFILSVGLLLTACFEISAQQGSLYEEGTGGGSPVYGGEGFSSSRNYFLAAKLKGSDSLFNIVEKNGYLMLAPGWPDNYTDTQQALWKISNPNQNTSDAGRTYQFESVSLNAPLGVVRSEAVRESFTPSAKANLFGKDITQWFPSSKSYYPGDNVFYHYLNDGKTDEVIALTAYEGRVIPRIYANLSAAEAAPDVLVITPYNPLPLALSANELNTSLLKNGLYDAATDRFWAAKNSYFHLSFNVNIPGHPFHTSLQAQGVELVETPASFATDLTVNPADAYKNDRSWVALYSREKEGYIVADTFLTDASVRFGITNKWYNADRARLLDSYLFRVLYDGGTNQLYVQSKAYIFKPTNNSWNKEAAINSSSVFHAFDGVNYLAYKKAGGAYMFTLDEKQDDFPVYMEKRDALYERTVVPDGLYLLQVTGTNANDNIWGNAYDRINKYLRYASSGTFEFSGYSLDYLQQDPSAQWIIETSANYEALIKIVNREYGKYGMTYLAENARTYKSSGNTFFFLGGDTLRYIPLSATFKSDKYIGYKHVDAGSSGLDVKSFTFGYSQGGGTLDAKADRTLWINRGNSQTAFTAESIWSERYGYTAAFDLSLMPLERTAYRLQTTDLAGAKGEKLYISYDPDVIVKRYFLQNNPAKASEFFLKETRRDWNGNGFYQLFEVNYVSGEWIELDEEKNVVDIYDNGVITNGKYLVTAEKSGASWIPKLYTRKEEVLALGRWVTPVDLGNSRYYAKYNDIRSVLYFDGTSMLNGNILDEETTNTEFTLTEKKLANETVGTAKVSVIGETGRVTVKGASGKRVVVSNLLGRTVADEILLSDETAVPVSAGIAVVAVEGEAAVKVIVR